eukprot:CAMPEP_0185017378 /NCGR_PEP_ID=MMETSP1103-20130426/337_1 /TAXON_ID=36769 /ORGANISM="Paraphysomonas bandaiensis, Strain Caron Lab Isolate" /LENGTH=281 /DNA_ID=CAMNT_0027546757 /DNA_START=183 /DNA_END=1028 /DNA_ORIENTATION=+
MDAVEWLISSDAVFEGSVFTGIPDMYDVYDFVSTKEIGIAQRAIDYQNWYMTVVEAIFQRLATGQCAIFSQTDAKVIDREGNVLCWIDKSHLCSVAAEKYGCRLLWHKIALNSDAEVSSHRPCYTHLVAYGRNFTYRTQLFRTPDVIDRGLMTWQKATGLEACILCISFIKYIVGAHKVINPFCGWGTVLAVANCFGLAALGIEVLPKRARRAMTRNLREIIDRIPAEKLIKLGVQCNEGLDGVVSELKEDILLENMDSEQYSDVDDIGMEDIYRENKPYS